MLKARVACALFLLCLIWIKTSAAKAPSDKCWINKQRCCYRDHVCGEKCQEGYGYRHCWKIICSIAICKDVTRSRAPPKPKDRVDWDNPTVIDCMRRPHACRHSPTPVDVTPNSSSDALFHGEDDDVLLPTPESSVGILAHSHGGAR